MDQTPDALSNELAGTGVAFWRKVVAGLSPLGRGLLMGAVLMAGGFELEAATRYVNGASGNDLANGNSPSTAWRTVQKAADSVNPGDEVLIAPGVYFERVALARAGTEEAPIVFRALDPRRNATVISGAVEAIRRGTQGWTLEDPALLLYSIPLDYEPVSVLAEDIDLYAYPTLAELQSFRVASANQSGKPAPGPSHGFAYEGGKLWVRLNARYGATDPGQLTMKVSPRRGGGFRGDVITDPSGYNWSVQTEAAAHVALEGLTFETPGFAGVWVHAGGVTVRGCWFRGCRAGVRGWGEAENRPTLVSADVTVQGCEFSQYPMFDDIQDVVAAAEALPDVERNALPPFFWWHRKGGARTMEIGLIAAGGVRWRLLGNTISDTLDGISYFGASFADRLEIGYNHFSRIVDNAVEVENHASHVRVHDNYVVDSYEPFSYQPNNGLPYPASIWFYRNIVHITPEAAEFWRKPILKWVPGCLKLKPPGDFVGVDLDGFLFFNNTIYFPSGDLFTLSQTASDGTGFKFFNNIFCTRGLQTGLLEPVLFNYEFGHNLVAPTEDGAAGPGAQAAGVNGLQVATVAECGLEDVLAQRYRPLVDSVVLGAGTLRAEMPGASVDLGALSLEPRSGSFESWRFHHLHFAGGLGWPAGDPDGDGDPTIVEALLGRDPIRKDGSERPRVALDETQHLTFQFLRTTVVPAWLDWNVQLTSDLRSWSSAGGDYQMLAAVSMPDGRTLETARDVSPAMTHITRYFRIFADTPIFSGEPFLILDPPPSPIAIDDHFTDGGRGNGRDPRDVAWYYVAPPNAGTAPTLSVAEDDRMGEGNAFQIDNATNAQTGSKSIVAPFVEKKLEEVGSHLELTFDFRFVHIAADHPLNFFRFGLYSSGGRPVTRDGDFKTGHAGYMISLKFGSSTAPTALIKESGTDGNFNNGDDMVVLNSSGELGLDVSHMKLSARLVLTREETGLRIAWQVLDGSGAVLVDASHVDPSGLFAFDELLFSSAQTELDYRVDRVHLELFGPQ